MIKKILLYFLVLFSFISISFGALTDNNQAYWSFDESIVTNNGATYTPTGKINGSYDFDGTSSYIDMGNSNSLTLDSFTLSSWIYITDFSSNNGIIGIGDGTQFFEWITLTDGTLYFEKDGSTRPTSITTNILSANTWYHVVLVYNSTTQTGDIYINGVEASYSTHQAGSGSLTIDGTTGNKYIGVRQSGTNYFSGTIDEPSIWNRALTPTEIQELYNSGAGKQTYDLTSTSGLVFSNTFDTDLNDDLTDNANKLTNNLASYTSNGKLNGAYDFDGVNDVITSANDLSFLDGSISLWVYPQILSQQALIERRDSAGGTTTNYAIYLMDYNSDGDYEFVLNYYNGAWNNIYLDDYSVSTNTWYNIIVVLNQSGTSKIYVNGIEKGSGTTGTLYTDTTDTTYIGNEQSYTYQFNGILDEVSIWNRALTSSEIQELYNNGNGHNPYAPSTTPTIQHNTKDFYNTENITVQLNTTTNTDMYYILDRDENIISDGLVAYYQAENNANDKVGNNDGTGKIDATAYYPFNGNANDESVNSNDGTVNGTTLTTDRFGSVNNAYEFDGLGTTDNIQIPSAIHLGQKGTIIMSLKSNIENLDEDGNNNYRRLYTSDSSDVNWVFEQSGALRIRLYDYSGNAYYSDVSANYWFGTEQTIVIFTYNADDGTYKIWYNGIKVKDVNIGTFTVRPPAGKSYIGGINDIYHTWDGRIDEVIILSGKTLSDSEATNINNLLTKHKLDKPYINSVNNDYGNAFDFDGVSSYIELNLNDITSPLHELSICVFVNVSDTGDIQTVINDADDNSLWFNIHTTDTYSVYLGDTSNPGYYYSLSSVTYDTPQHVCFTYNSTLSELKFYVNGNFDSQYTTTGNIDLSSINSIITLGRREQTSTSNYYVNGYVDEVRIYNRTLSSTEIELLYNTSPYNYICSNCNSTNLSLILNEGSHNITYLAFVSDGTNYSTNTSFVNRVWEKTITQQQEDLLELTSTSYATILGGSFNTNNIDMYNSINIFAYSNDTNQISCHSVLDGVSGKEFYLTLQPNRVTHFRVGSIFNTIPDGSHTISLECKKYNSSSVFIGFSSGIGKAVNNQITSTPYNSDSNKVNVSSTTLTQILHTQINTSYDVIGSDKKILVEVLGTAKNYDELTDVGVETIVRISDGTTSQDCSDVINRLRANATSTIGDVCVFDVSANTTYDIYYYGYGGSGTNVEYDVVMNIKELDYNTTELDFNQISTTSFTGSDYVVDTLYVNNDYDDNVYLNVLLSGVAKIEHVNFSIDIVSTNYSLYSPTVPIYTQDAPTYDTRYNLQYSKKIPKGDYTITIKADCQSGETCEIQSNDLVYLSSVLELTTNSFNISAYDRWDSNSISNFSITTSNGLKYTTTNGIINIITPNSFMDLTYSADNYINRSFYNHDTTTDMNESLWQSIWTIVSEDLVNPFSISNFTISTDVGDFSTTTGEITIYPNINRYNFSFISSYFNRTFEIDINSTSDEYNVEPTRIEIFFTRVTDGGDVINVNLSEASAGYIGNSGSNNSILYFLEPGNYSFTATTSNYITQTQSVEKQADPIYSTYTFVLNPIYDIEIYDEKFNQIFNISSADTIILNTFCEDETKNTQQTIENNTFTIPIDCDVYKLKFTLEYGTDTYFRTIKPATDPTEKFRVYLMDLTHTQAVKTVFNLIDILNEYDNVALNIKKNINGTVYGITWDKVDATGKVVAYLIENDEYILEVESSDNPTKSLGYYVAQTQLGDVVLTLFQIAFSVDKTVNYGNILFSSYIDENTENLVVKYQDLTNTTTKTELTIKKDGKYGTTIYTDAQLGVDSGEFIWDRAGYENDSYYVEVNLYNDNGVTTYTDIIDGNGEIGFGFIDFTLDMNWIIVIFLGFLSLTLTVSTASTGALVVSVIGAMFMFFGWFSISVSMISISILLSILNLIREGEKK